jgi:predicted dehydrogenase
MAKKIRVGVIGAGWPAWQHIKGYQRIGGVEVAALCDLDEKRLHGIADEYGIAGRYASYPDMLEQEPLDAVSVCSPNALHAEMSVKAMQKGAHVICEKPMSSDSASARRMVKVSRQTRRILMIGYQRRFAHCAQYLKRQIAKGRFGEIYFVRAHWLRRSGIPGLGGWFTRKEMSGGGALIDIGVHVLDLAMWFLGYPDVKSLSSSWGSRFGAKGLGAMDGVWRAQDKGGTFDVEDYAMGACRSLSCPRCASSGRSSRRCSISSTVSATAGDRRARRKRG